MAPIILNLTEEILKMTPSDSFKASIKFRLKCVATGICRGGGGGMSKIILVLFLLFFPAHVFAGEAGDPRFYISGSAAKLFGSEKINYSETIIMTDTEKRYGSAVDSSVNGEIDYDFAVIGAIGMKFKNSMRVELEYSYRKGTPDGDANNTLDRYHYQYYGGGVDFSKPDWKDYRLDEPVKNGSDPFEFKVPASGDQQIHALMFNVYKDFPIKTFFTPYVGVGLGVAIQETKYSVDNANRIKLYDLFYNNLVILEPFKYQENKTKTALGFQGMLGTTVELTQSISMNVGYRIFGTSEDILIHGVEAGLRFSF